jgi:hypothetical protein
MIKSITVINGLGESTVLELRSPEQSGFFVREIQGLGPGKATINSTEVLSIDGGFYNSAHTGVRNIVFSLGFLEKPTIEDTRLSTYRIFPLKQLVTLIIETDLRTALIEGYVESNEPDIFTNSSGCVISIICPNRFFYDLDNITSEVVFSGVTSSFVFPFSNESLTEDELVFGEIILLTEQNILYDGDAENGVIITLHTHHPVTNPIIYNDVSKEWMEINTASLEYLTGAGFDDGDTITISTIKGDKRIELLRDGEIINIINCLEPNSTWLHLHPGDNVFGFSADTGQELLQIRIEYQTIYEGV